MCMKRNRVIGIAWKSKERRMAADSQRTEVNRFVTFEAGMLLITKQPIASGQR